MIHFKEWRATENSSETAQFTISVDGDKDDYIETLQALLRAVQVLSNEDSTENECFYLTNLIRGMLPNYKQVINIDEVEKLEEIKQQNKSVVNEITKEK